MGEIVLDPSGPSVIMCILLFVHALLNFCCRISCLGPMAQLMPDQHLSNTCVFSIRRIATFSLGIPFKTSALCLGMFQNSKITHQMNKKLEARLADCEASSLIIWGNPRNSVTLFDHRVSHVSLLYIFPQRTTNRL